MSEASPSRFSNPWVRGAVALAAAALATWRLNVVLGNPQFWAEDGALFFADAAKDSSRGIEAIFSPYAGYLHLIPRLIAVAGTLVPILNVPLFYAVAAILALGVTAWAIQSPRIRLPGGWVAALALAAIPHTGEVYGVICNIQWIGALLLFGVLIADDGKTPVQCWLDRAAVLVTGLTGPFIVLAIPLFGLRALARKTRESVILLGASLLCCVIQLPALLFHRPEQTETRPWDLGRLVAVLGRRLIVGVFAGQVAVPMWASILSLAAAAALVGTLLWRWRERLPGGLILAMLASLVLVASVIKIRLDQMPYGDFIDGDRYFFTAKVILIWLLAAIALRAPLAGRAALFLLFAVALFANRARFVFPAQPDMGWPAYAEVLERGQSARVPILPRGFYLWVPSRRPHP